MPDHPKAIGDRSEAHVLAALVDHYPTVLTPWGENCRYDFVIETDEGELLRVQCRTGRLRGGAVRFPSRSVSYHHPLNRRNGPTEIEPTRNGQEAGIRWAADYELHPPE